MSEICIYIKMPSYLRQWLIHRHGGSEPVQLVRGSAESDFLKSQPPSYLMVSCSHENRRVIVLLFDLFEI